jgi:hypothetical protein
MSKRGLPITLAASVMLLSVVLLAPIRSQAEEAAHPNAGGYPAVGDVPSRPDKPAMTTDEMSKLKKDLGAARDRQIGKGKPSAGTAPAKP